MAEKSRNADKAPKKLWQKILVRLGIAAGVVAAIAVAGFLIVLTVLTITEYKPADSEEVEASGESSEQIAIGDSMTIMSWNIGYGSLGDYADFFMDGGTHVNTSTTEQVENNLSAIGDEIHSVDPDVVFLQEVDLDSKRSHYIDEQQTLMDGLSGYQTSFGYNYKVLYVPYPLPTIGKVNCGITTFSKYAVSSAERVSLPCPFSYPYRLCNLKRCLLVNRVQIEGSDKELVLVNLHLEAYDDGDGKAAQTEMLRELLQTEADAGNYVIAGGDFNQSFSNIDTSTVCPVNQGMWEAGQVDVSAFGSDWQFVMDDTTASCRSLDSAYAGSDQDTFQYYIIDGFIVSGNITVENLETEDLQFENSDHNPIVMNVTLEE